MSLEDGDTSSSTCSQEQSLVVKTRHKKTRKMHHHEVFPRKILMIQIMIRPLIKTLGPIPITDVCIH